MTDVLFPTFPTSTATAAVESSSSMSSILYNLPLTDHLLDILSFKASNLIQVQEGQKLAEKIPELSVFISRVIRQSKVSANVVAVACIYLDRLKARLPENARGLPCTRHRVLLAALIISFKYLNDVGMRNRRWARISGVFDVAEVNLMERQFLHLVDYALGFTACELDPLLEHSWRQQQLHTCKPELAVEVSEAEAAGHATAFAGFVLPACSSLLPHSHDDCSASQMTVRSSVSSSASSVGSLSPPPSLTDAFMDNSN